MRLSSAQVKVYQIPYANSETTSRFLYTLLKRNSLKWKFLSFSSAQIKICQISHANFEMTSPLQNLSHSSLSWQLWIKGCHQNPNFETFKSSGEICYIPYVISQTASHLKVMFDKSVNVLGEGMQFLEKCSPLNFNFLDFPQLVWSYPNSSYDFWNLESVLYKFCTIL